MGAVCNDGILHAGIGPGRCLGHLLVPRVGLKNRNRPQLGSALLGYEGFEECGLKIVTAFDASPARIGSTVHGRVVRDVATLADFIREHAIAIGIICVPAACAQEVADAMVAGGVKAIWNFANVSLKTPEEVIVQREVIAGGLAVLSVKMHRQAARGEEYLQ